MINEQKPDQREVMRMALNALKITRYWSNEDPAVISAIAALRQALEAPPKSAGHASDCAVHNEPAYPAGPCDCKPPEIVAAVPVAFAITMPSGEIVKGEEIYSYLDEAEDRLNGCIPGCGIAPLYITPPAPAREPLTEDQARKAIGAGDAYWTHSKIWLLEVVRAIESAHGITPPSNQKE